MEHRQIIVFDGVCNLCNSAVNFIIKRDHNNVFVFAPMQTDAAQKIIADYDLKDFKFDTFILIKKNYCYYRSDAALEITRDLSGFWSLFRIFKLVPAPIRDLFYRLLAKNRYRIFGKRDECMLPTAELKDKFLD